VSLSRSEPRGIPTPGPIYTNHAKSGRTEPGNTLITGWKVVRESSASPTIRAVKLVELVLSTRTVLVALCGRLTLKAVASSTGSSEKSGSTDHVRLLGWYASEPSISAAQEPIPGR
jgi:hypothetical protein